MVRGGYIDVPASRMLPRLEIRCSAELGAV